jgi:hypothetical protein
MITPPFGISAIPRFTRAEPVKPGTSGWWS